MTAQLQEIPPHMEQIVIQELAKVFVQFLGRPRASDLEAYHFTDIADLLLRGWIIREPGRYQIGYMPGPEVQREMWKLNPHLCGLLRLEAL